MEVCLIPIHGGMILINRFVLVWIISMTACLSALGNEATNSSITITGISPQIDSTLKDRTVDFEINVDYDLKDDDYGKILLSIDEHTTGSADQVYTISPGDQRQGSHTFKISEFIGEDWENVYVSATLYDAKIDNPLPAEYSAFDYREFSLKTILDESVILNMCSLPSTQGWTYSAHGTSRSEEDAFSIQGSVQDCILHQNTLGMGYQNQGNAGYTLSDVVDATKPFILKIRAKVTQEEQANDYNHWGFCFEVDTGSEAFGIGISPNVIAALDDWRSDKVLTNSIDNTEFHDYRLEATPGVGYKLYVDNVLVGSGLPRSQSDIPDWEGLNRIYLGDGTGGCNAIADVASFEFTQSANHTSSVKACFI